MDDATPQQPQPEEEWLLTPSTGPAAEPLVTQPGVASVRPAEGRRTLVVGSGLVAAGLVAGAVGTFALGHRGAAATTFQNAGATSRTGPGGLGGLPTGPGGRDGEQRLQGTLTAIGSSSVTVSTGSRTVTYPVTSTTQIVRDGQAATLSQLRKGDPVSLHVYPVNGRTVVERIFAGTAPQGSFPGGPGAPGGFAPGGPGTTQQTQPSGVING